MIEVQTVHLGADQVPVDLLRLRPVTGAQCLEPHPPARKLGMLPLHGGCAVVRNAVYESGGLEGAPFLKERDQVVMVPSLDGAAFVRARGRRRTRCKGHCTAEDADQGQSRELRHRYGKEQNNRKDLKVCAPLFRLFVLQTVFIDF